MSEIDQQKRALRDTFKRLRAKARAAAPDAEARMADHVAASDVVMPGSVVSGFMPIGDEPDPVMVLGDVFGAVTYALPVMMGAGKALTFRIWAPGEPLNELKWGIREPLQTAPVVLPTVVLVPLLAFDRKGYRLGYGGGFYDRTLAELRALQDHPRVAIGLAFDAQETDDLPIDQYDQAVDAVLTPSGLRRIA